MKSLCKPQNQKQCTLPGFFLLMKFSSTLTQAEKLVQPWRARVRRRVAKALLQTFKAVQVYYTMRGCESTTRRTTRNTSRILIALGQFGTTSKAPAFLNGNACTLLQGFVTSFPVMFALADFLYRIPDACFWRPRKLKTNTCGQCIPKIM